MGDKINFNNDQAIMYRGANQRMAKMIRFWLKHGKNTKGPGVAFGPFFKKLL